MSSAYNQVPSLTTVSPLKMGLHHHHQQQQHSKSHHHRPHHSHNRHGPPLIGAGSSASLPTSESSDLDYQSSSRQRKWRVLVSIGLLLPALAAIIGIVAWAISIEVANGGASQMGAASAMARQAERVQQQQLRREEAVALAALIAARRPNSPQPRVQQPVSAPLVQSAAHLQANELGQPARTGDDSNHVTKQQQLRAPQVMVARASSSRPVRTSSQQQQVNQQQANSRQVQQQPRQVQPKQTGQSSEMTQPRAAQTMVDDSQAAMARSFDGAPATAESEEVSATMAESEPSPTASEKEEPAVSSQEPVQDSSAMVDRSDEETEQRKLDASEQEAEQPYQRPVEVTSTTAAPSSGRHRSPMVVGGTKSADQKSRWLSAGKAGKLVSPAASAKQAHLSGPKKHSKTGADVAKRNSKYTLVSTTEETPATADDADQTTPQSTSATTTTTPTTTTTTTTSTEKPTTADCEEARRAQQAAEPIATGEDEQPPVKEEAEVSFEAIASAISKSLHDSQEQAAEASTAASAMADLLSDALAKSANRGGGDGADEASPLASADEVTDSEGHSQETGGAPASSTSSDDSTSAQTGQAAKRRRTTGEHLAEVIDHIVDKRQRQQQRTSRFGQRASAAQIVVVAPVGPSGALLKARSQTKASESQAAPSKSGKINSGQQKKASGEAAKKAGQSQSPKQKEAQKSRVGGRLLGVAEASPSASAKYSERVEVIEDDDSSALLMAPVKSSGDGDDNSHAEADPQEAAYERRERESGDKNLQGGEQPHEPSVDLMHASNSGELLSSVHVSSHAGEPRLRSPRHEMGHEMMFERYARAQPDSYPQQQQQQQQQHQPPRPLMTVNGQSQVKLYSAEQLIREHVLKSKARGASNIGQGQHAHHQHYQHQQQQPQMSHRPPVQQLQQESSVKQHFAAAPQSTTTTTTTTTTSTTARPSAVSEPSTTAGPSTTTAAPPGGRSQGTPAEQQQNFAASRQQTRNDEQQMHAPTEMMQEHASSMQPVQVPALYMQPQHQQRGVYLRQVDFDPFQTMESQQQQQQVQIGPQVVAGQYPENQNYQQQQHEQQEQQQAVASQLPVFADQEIQVPAHMADTVIRDLQLSASTVTGMLNGQPAGLFQAQPTIQFMTHQQMAQVPQQSANNHQLYQQQQQMYNNYQPHHHQQQQAQYYRPAQVNSASESQHRPVFMQPSPYSFMQRLAAARRHQFMSQQRQQQQQQVLANRASAASGPKDDKLPVQQVQQPSGSLIDSVKSFGPRSLIQPVAQMALKGMFSSLSQQAAAQQAQIDAMEQQQQRSMHHQSRSSAAVAANSIATPVAAAPTTGGQSSPPGDSVQAAGSQQVAVAVPAEPAMIAASGRSMRSLPIGAQAPVSARQVQPIQDQEVQESYGQMPAYHMPPSGGHHYGGGGGGDNYQGDHDKKTKGITFHFGGGPIGGGTQLITSPMGIFKHLMIPLMPNPRVNLNGKVVFGVVLEKSTAFGPPPKKKHKFWGR